MEQVKFLRGTRNAVDRAVIPDGTFCYVTDSKELLMKMDNDLVPLDNSVYWVLEGQTRLLPNEVNKRVAYDFNDNTFYIAYDNRWKSAKRDASISSGVLIL